MKENRTLGTVAVILMLSWLLAVALSSAFAQDSDSLDNEPLTVWMEIPTAPITPQARYWHVMVYDSVLGEVLIHGGTGGSGYPRPRDTWTWNGVRWLLRHSSGPSIGLCDAAFDPLRGVTVLHGGLAPTGFSGTTWEYDGRNWRAVSGASGGPGVRVLATMAYDPVRGRILLHGGSPDLNLHVFYNDTWEWDGTTWQLIAGASGPRRLGGRMVYDAGRGVMVLFGGINGFNSQPVDTWEFYNGQWQQVATEGPDGCNLLQMYYDPVGEVMVMQREGQWPENFLPGTFQVFDDTWEWDGIAWRQRDPLVPTRDIVLASAAAYDAGRGRLVRFGGETLDRFGNRIATRETWEHGSFERIRLGQPWINEDGVFSCVWTGGVPPFQLEECLSFLDDDWHDFGRPTAQLQTAMPANASQGFFRVAMAEGTFAGTEYHVDWLAQPPAMTNASGNIRIEGWEELRYDDADDDRLHGYVTVYIDALEDPQGVLLEAGGTFQVRQKLDAQDISSGSFDPAQVVQGGILWEGRYTLDPAEGANAVAVNSAGLTAFYMHDATEDPIVHQFVGRIHDPGP